MNLLNDWIPENLLQALGWTLVHSIWQLILISAFLWIALKLFSKKSPEFKYKLAVAALGMSLIVAFATLWYEFSVLPAIGSKLTTSSELIFFQLSGGIAESNLTWIESSILWIESQIPLFVNFWFFGSILFLMRLFTSLSEIRSLRKASINTEDYTLLAAVEKVRKRLGISRNVSLRITQNSLSPLTFGVFKPMILIPAGLIFHLSPSQLEAIIAHELAHIKRYDYLTNLMESMMEVFFFYHPCFWWMNQTVKELRENAADDLAVSTGVEPKELAYSLAEVLNFKQQNAPELAMTASKRRNPTLHRIKRMMGFPAQIYPQNPIISLPMLLTLLLSAGLMASAQQDSPLNTEREEPNVYLENPDLGDFIPKSELKPTWTKADTSKKEETKKVIKVEGEEPMIWESDGNTFILKGQGSNSFQYQIKGDTLISNGDTIIMKGKTSMIFKNGPSLSPAPKLDMMVAPEFPENFMVMAVPEFPKEMMPPMVFDMEIMESMPPMPNMPLKGFNMPPMPPMHLSDTSEMSGEEREKWVKEWEAKAELWAKKAEESMKEFEPKLKEWQKKMEDWQKSQEPRMKEFEQQMKAWEKENEPRVKAWEEKMKAWEKEQEPKLKEFEAKMKEWEKSQQPKIEEFQRKMEEWQKENAKKMEEFRKAIEAEFKKTKEDSKN
jgi:beta-lactamase regulating signal transducer with metallopeptidase domain